MEAIRRDEVLIEVDELKQIINQSGVRVFDATVLVNQQSDAPSAFATYEQAHIPGAAFFDHQAFSDPNGKYQFTVPSDADLAKALGIAGVDNDCEVVFYSTSMIAWATRAWWLLKHAGHDKVRVLNGGYKAWVNAGGEIEAGVQTFPATSFNVNARPGYFVDKEQMQAAVSEAGVTAVHSLAQPVYDQAHIPGSVCQPCTDFMQDEGTRLLENDLLQQKLVANDATGKTITYCGGGVAATVNAIVCQLVGNPDVSVYDGSMSEWVGEGLPTDSRS